METALEYLKIIEWSANKGLQCICCEGKNPSVWRPGPRVGHNKGCAHEAAIAALAADVDRNRGTDAE
ncbi:MAG: hypothetical protein ACI88C_000079 [Acidimicrobiales bacterium]|jgi:hypothetical protein